MTEQDFKERHIPHRINLLITYRERFVKLTGRQRENFRDLDRCAKDIAGMMIRSLLDEMGIHLPAGTGKTIVQRSPKQAYVRQLSLMTIKSDKVTAIIEEALKFGNRAIAHIEGNDVDHNFRTAQDDIRLVKAIDYVEDKVIQNIYGTRAEYDRVMGLADNNMHRDRLNLATI
ncbi:MAG: hypothetical protein KDB88_02020 [Flavobacteriales bacterium]|nr:hypothetical protein [Flavobacteriales bacterium]